jgi:hypothetical protein
MEQVFEFATNCVLISLAAYLLACTYKKLVPCVVLTLALGALTMGTARAAENAPCYPSPTAAHSRHVIAVTQTNWIGLQSTCYQVQRAKTSKHVKIKKAVKKLEHVYAATASTDLPTLAYASVIPAPASAPLATVTPDPSPNARVANAFAALGWK